VLNYLRLAAPLAVGVCRPAHAASLFAASVETNQFFQPLALAAGLATLFGVCFFVWNRERRMQRQRERLRKTYHLSEEILSASSPEAIYKRINDALVAILGVSGLHLYVYNRATKTLDALTGEHEEAVSISLSAPPGGTY